MRIVVGVTGASGAIIAKRLLEVLQTGKTHEIHLIISESGKLVIEEELGEGSLEKLTKLADFYYDENDLKSKLASSSFLIDAMIIIPCSMKTLAAIALGYSANLITRCAENLLKFNRKLILVPRDTPLSLSAIENMKKAKLAGAIILPLNIAFYYKPKHLEEIINFFVGKILDSLDIENNLYKRWSIYKK
jgi:4-hydroxy-3-polyprenylbenzoate decarboxylase